MTRATLLVALALALALGGCAESPAPTPKPKAGFRSEVRKQLAEEWGDAYAECLRDDEYWGAGRPGHKYPGYPKVDDYMRQTCRDMANEILP